MSDLQTQSYQSVGISKGVLAFFILLLILIIGVGGWVFLFSTKPSKSLLSTLQSMVPANPTDTASKTFMDDVQKVKLLWGSGKYSDSLTSAQNLLNEAKTDSEKSTAHYWIGLSYYHLNNAAKTEQEELLAVQLDPKFDAPYVTLAAISLGRNDCQQALSYSQTAVDLDGSWAWGHNDLGLSYLCLGDKDKGIAELRRAVELDPNTYVFQYNLNIELQPKK